MECSDLCKGNIYFKIHGVNKPKPISFFVLLSFITSLFFNVRLIDAQEYSSHDWEKNPRLPKSVVPDLYNLTLNPNLGAGTFSGKVNISLNVSTAVSNIILHSTGLSVTNSALISHEKGSENLVKQAFNYEPNEFLVVQLKQDISPGSYNLLLEFNGSLTRNIVGFYRSMYKDVSTGENRQIATTKFEPTYARQAFPCFDEPSFKAKFNISLVRPSSDNYIALSNMNQINEVADSPSAGLTTVTFATSVKMSTYLACFIVCDFNKLPPLNSTANFPVTVYARRGQEQNMQFALDLTKQTIDYYITYFGIPYPLPKIDLIAIPDFVSGAMENWGLITFRETSILYNNQTTSSGTMLNIAMTVTHELAHMWFGNLVTMKWWDDLWLNEGFASFMQYKGVHNAHPEWEVDSWFLISKLHGVLQLDGTLSSHPIVQDVSHPDQITEIFDTISYSKGSSVIRMLEHFMGEDNFRNGITSYLNAFQWDNAETADLWEHLQKYSNGINLVRVMGTWTKQMGYPVISVKRQGSKIIISQTRFLSDKDASYNPSSSVYGYKWDVPISYFTSQNSTESNAWLMLEDESVSVDIGGATWIKLNKNEKFYYRVNYEEADWELLGQTLQTNFQVMGASDRANLLDDVFSLAEAGYVKYATALNLTKYLEHEGHPVPWSVASDALVAIKTRLLLKSQYSQFQKYAQSIIAPHITNDIWDIASQSDFLQKRLSVELLALGCSFGLPSCLNKTKQLFLSWIENPNTTVLDVEVKSLVYVYGMQQCDSTEWEILWTRYVNEIEPQEKLKLRGGLSAVKNPSILSKLVNLATNEEYVRSQDYFSVLAAVSRNPIGSPIVWDWIRENWDYLVNRFTLNDRQFGRLLPAVTKNFDSNTKLQELELFLQQHPEEGAGAAGRKSAVENIKLNIKWNEKNFPSLIEFLNSLA
uniref:Aminopeptidase n=1 Tax=Clastoptera arizonana TaxID=38151 RepID=A0A1B6C9L0_9HEMI